MKLSWPAEFQGETKLLARCSDLCSRQSMPCPAPTEIRVFRPKSEHHCWLIRRLESNSGKYFQSVFTYTQTFKLSFARYNACNFTWVWDNSILLLACCVLVRQESAAIRTFLIKKGDNLLVELLNAGVYRILECVKRPRTVPTSEYDGIVSMHMYNGRDHIRHWAALRAHDRRRRYI